MSTTVRGALGGHFRGLARYNRLANERLYAACATLTESEFKAVRPAFFKSIRGTLNHILVGDRIWLARFAGRVVSSTGLDAIPYADMATLRPARIDEDLRIVAFADGLSDESLAGTIRYVNNEGRLLEDPVDLLVAHFFNHQTHHRGQVHDMLMQTPARPPVLDLHWVLRS